MPNPPGHHPVEPDTPAPEDPVRRPLHEDHPGHHETDDDDDDDDDDDEAGPDSAEPWWMQGVAASQRTPCGWC